MALRAASTRCDNSVDPAIHFRKKLSKSLGKRILAMGQLKKLGKGGFGLFLFLTGKSRPVAREKIGKALNSRKLRQRIEKLCLCTSRNIQKYSHK